MSYLKQIQDVFQAYDSGSLSQEEAAQAIADLDRWVHVDDELPKSAGEYLIWSEIDAQISEFGHDAWEIGPDHPADLGWFYDGLNVTHWQDIISPAHD